MRIPNNGSRSDLKMEPEKFSAYIPASRRRGLAAFLIREGHVWSARRQFLFAVSLWTVWCASAIGQTVSSDSRTMPDKGGRVQTDPEFLKRLTREAEWQKRT